MLKNAFKKYPPQNRTNVQIKGGGGQRPFEQCSKKLHFFEMRASLSSIMGFMSTKPLFAVKNIYARVIHGCYNVYFTTAQI